MPSEHTRHVDEFRAAMSDGVIHGQHWARVSVHQAAEIACWATALLAGTFNNKGKLRLELHPDLPKFAEHPDIFFTDRSLT